MINIQPAEKPVHREDGSLEIHSLFETLQGECEYAGMPAIFVRAAGCSLKCNFCDTIYADKRELMSVEQLVDKIKSIRPALVGNLQSLVVLTGGESLRQNIAPLIYALLKNYYRIQIETNGIHPPPTAPLGMVSLHGTYSLVCSPKTPSLNPKLKGWVNAYKYVLAAGEVDPTDGLPTITLGSMRPARPFEGEYTHVWIQPQDDQDSEKNKANMQVAIDSCLKFGYRLSIQTHKLAGLP